MSPFDREPSYDFLLMFYNNYNSIVSEIFNVEKYCDLVTCKSWSSVNQGH